MGLIPLLPGNTVAYTKDAYERSGGANGSAILIFNCEESQFSGAFAKATYDLTVGSEYRDHRHESGQPLDVEEEIELLPGAAVIVKTAESVQFPRRAFGLIVPKVDLLQKGISNTTSKVDPGYGGSLLVTVFNLGRRTETLKRGERFACLYAISVQDDVALYSKPSKSIPTLRRAGLWGRLLDRIEARQSLFNVLVLLATLLSISLNVWLLFSGVSR